MKKFVFSLFIAALVALSSSVSHAANWQWIGSNDEVGCFFDTETIRYGLQKSGVNKTKIVCWEKAVFTQKGADLMAEQAEDPRLHHLDHVIALKYYLLPRHSYILRHITFFDHDDNVISSLDYKKEILIIPDSKDDYIFISIRDYARRHHDELIDHTLGN